MIKLNRKLSRASSRSRAGCRGLAFEPLEERRLLAFTGNPPITPRWGFEPWVWEDETNTQASTTALVDGYQSRDIPVGAVVIDSPFARSYMSFEFDPARYADPQQMTADFRDEGVQVVVWVVGMINNTSPDTPLDQHPDFNFVRAQNYQVTDPDGDDIFSYWKGTGMGIDFTNPDAVDWFISNNNADLIDWGVRGFKVDESNSYLNTSSGMLETSAGSIFAGGEITKAEYTSYYYASMYDWIFEHTAATDHDGLTISRPYSFQGQPAGNQTPISKLPAGWCGDFHGDWDGFEFQISNIYTSAEAGYSAVGFEVGGYQSVSPTADSLTRQAQFAALLPIMENGGTNGGETQHLPWYWDGGGGTTYTDIYRYYATLHSNLAPFQFHSGVVANLSGVPAVTETYSDGAANIYRHVLSDTFLTQAVIGGNNTVVDMSFPAGHWIDWWDQTTMYAGGGSIAVESALDQAPLYVRAGSIVPVDVDSDVTGLGDANSAGKDTVLFYPSGSTSLTYHRWLTDGISYEDVDLSSDEAAGTVTVSSPTSRTWLLRVKSFDTPSSVSGADSWSYDAASDVVVIEKTGANFTVTINGLSGYSSVTPIETDTVPSVPTGLAATAADSKVFLDWASNTEFDLASYTVYRSTTSGSGYVPIATALTESSYLDASASNGTTYYYVVTATDAASNESGYSAEVSATPQEGLPDLFAVSNLTVSSGAPYDWFTLGAGELVYTDRTYTYDTPPAIVDGKLALRTANDDKLLTTNPHITFDVNRPATIYVLMDTRVTTPAWMSGFTDTGQAVTTIGDNANPTMEIWAANFPVGTVSLGGNEGVSASDMYTVVVVENSDAAPPAAPIGLVATAGHGSVTLNWDDNSEPDIASYTVYRSTTSGGGYSAIAGGLTASFYTDNTAFNGTTYYYVVTATDLSANESANSAEVSVTPIQGSGGPISVVNSATGSGSGASSCTISGFELGEGDALVVMVSTEGPDSSPSYSVTYGGSNVTDSVFVNIAQTGVAIFYLINPPVSSGDVVVAFDGSSIYTVSAISLSNVASLGDHDTFSQGAGSGSTSLAYNGSADGVVVAALTDNGWHGNLPSISGGNISSYAAQVAGTTSVSAGRAHAFGTILSSGSFSITYTWGDTNSSRNAGAMAAFVAIPPDATPPAPPTGLVAYAGHGVVNIDWDDNAEPDLASYTVYRSTTSGGGYTTIASDLANSAYTDDAGVYGTTYCYVVTATDTSSNESAGSAEVSLAPQILGDYNLDRVVDAADYTVWRDHMGAGVPLYSGADGSGDGYVDEEDFDVWKSRFGQTFTAPSPAVTATAPPQPVETSVAVSTTETESPIDAALATFETPARFSSIQRRRAPATHVPPSGGDNDLLLLLLSRERTKLHGNELTTPHNLGESGQEESLELALNLRGDQWGWEQFLPDEYAVASFRGCGCLPFGLSK